ncbi:zinc ribbon domain-containing protein [Thermaurantimonas sp.]|uniref:zinc ribbon domain-containing protein n=1 Tax=Thermaurantimonas sp. TaxID=2681568 RepID=UPI00391C8819
MSQEVTVEMKLRALYDLQLIDSRIDKIKAIRGDLPLEVQDLEDEIEGLNTRVEKLNQEIAELENDIKSKKIFIKSCLDKINKYKEQQKNVRNNREFEALSKEIEYQELDIKLAEKRMNEAKARIESKNTQIQAAQEKIAELTSHLEYKKQELESILEETSKEEDILLKKSEEFAQMIEPRLLAAYKRIRERMKNGLAVVPVERGASMGSFFTIPPQRQLEIQSRKKIIIDEHSGRILVDSELAREEEEKINKLIESIR